MSDDLHDDNLCVGRDRQLDSIVRALAGGQSAVLIGGRMTGKTRLARRLTPQLLGRRLVWTDASDWDRSSQATALAHLRTAVEDRQEDAYATATQHEVRQAFLNGSRPLTVVIDSADRLIGEPWHGSFFAFLRSLDTTHLRTDLSLLLIGGPVLYLHKDRTRGGSPPLGDAKKVLIEPLDEPAVAELIARAGLDPAPKPGDVMRLAGGQAWLTVQLLTELRDSTLEHAKTTVFDSAIGMFEEWAQQLGPSGREFVRKLPRTGLPPARVPDLTRSYATLRVCTLVGVVRVEADVVVDGPELFMTWFRSQDPHEQLWDVAISFAPDDEDSARGLAESLRPEFNVFFAPEQQLWEPDLVDRLPGLFQSQSKCVVALSTPQFVHGFWRDELAVEQPLLLLRAGAVPEGWPEAMVVDRAALRAAVRALCNGRRP